MARHSLIPVFVLILLLTASLSAQYQHVDYALPTELGPGVRDSILRDIVPPEPVYPPKGAKEAIRAAVWLRVTVGELGKVKHAEVIRCINPGYGFEKAALDAVPEAIFLPQWDGVYAREYVGYYPVLFVDPHRHVLPRHLADKAYGSLPGSRWRISGAGLDAPEISPLQPLAIIYPAKALATLMEADASVKVRVNRKGQAVSVDVKEVSVPGYDFASAAEEAVHTGSYPIKTENGRPVDYSAYVPVEFRLTPELLRQAGAPDPDHPAPVDTPPKPVAERRQTYSEEAFKLRLAGKAVVAALIDTTGRLVTAFVDSSSGSDILDHDALGDVRRMQFYPAKQDGKPVRAWLRYLVNFDVFAHDSSTTMTVIEDTVDGQPTTRIINETHGSVSGTDSSGLVIDRQISPYANIEPPEILPKFTHFEKSVYPPQVLNQGIQGTVKVAALVDENGKILDTVIAHSSGNRSLDSAAVVTIGKHKFAPGTTGGTPVKAWMAWFVHFKPGSKEIVAPGTATQPKR